MKNTCLTLLLISVSLFSFAQKDFEGIMVFRDQLISKLDGISNASWAKILAISESSTCSIKKGNFKVSSDRKDTYYMAEKQKLFFRFKGIDTLYYLDYDDTTTVWSVNKTNERKRIAGFDCSSLVIETPMATSRYFYSPSIYMNPEYNKNNKIDQYNVFARETSSLFLALEQETKLFSLKQTCVQVEEKPINESVFTLPALPQKKLDWTSFIRFPYYEGKEGWAGYLQKNIDANVAARYVRIGRKEDAATQVVIVNFAVSESGTLSGITVVNKKEVHPKLAEEAVRVIAASGKWHPATAFGEPISYRMTQPVSFQVTKQ